MPSTCPRCSTQLASEAEGERCSHCQYPIETGRPEGRTPAHLTQQATLSYRATALAKSPVDAEAKTVIHYPVENENLKEATGAISDAVRFSPSPSLPTQLDDYSLIERTSVGRMPQSPPGYELLGRLGGGGMGDVFLAREVSTERTVAIKFLRAASNPMAVERFLTEVRALARVDHPNLIKVLATDFYCLTPFFTMEFAPGGTLADLLEKSGPVPAEESVKLLIQASRAIHAAHQAQVLHRDIKPSNILLAADGSAKVADFGLAKRTDHDDCLTLTSNPIGTPSFMPPEQVSRKHGELGPASDVYSLGASLYYILSGQPPFAGESSAEIVVKVVAETPQRLRAVKPEVPLGLEAIVMKCLEKKPEDRYPSAAELADDLERFLNGGVEQAPRLTRRRRMGRWLRSKRSRLGAVGLLFGSAGLGMILPAGLYLATREARPVDPLVLIQRELSAGKPVTLIGATGLPRWYDRPIGGLEVSTDLVSGGACTLSAVGQGLLVLLPGVPCDYYQVDAEFQQLRLPPPGNGVAFYQWEGLCVGYDAIPLADGGRMHFFFSQTFRDFASQGRSTMPVTRCGADTITETPGKNPRVVRGDILYRYPFTESLVLPAKWRKVRLVVAPGRIQAFWREDGKPEDSEESMHRFADLGPDKIGERISHTDDTMSRYIPPIGAPTPAWSPRRGIAIWCAYASVAVRNVTVTPIVPTP